MILATRATVKTILAVVGEFFDELARREGGLNAMGLMCAWARCERTFHGPMPDGWRHLLVLGASRPVGKIEEIPPKTWDRDAVLCPEHARELEGQLKRVR